MSLVDLIPGASTIKLVAIGLAVAGAVGIVGYEVHQYGNWRAAEVKAQWDAERAKLNAEVQAQRDRNLDLQRAAEKGYTVQAGIRDHFITQTIMEVRYATANLASCPVSPAAVRLLNAAADCASSDRPAACGADQPVRPPGPAS